MVAEHESKLEHPSERFSRNLAVEVEGALWAYDPIRQAAGTIGVASDDAGAVQLSGIVPSWTIAEIAEDIAAAVPGVTRVSNSLVSDTELQSEVARGLADDQSVAVSTDRITISSLLGLVYLGGEVAAPELADAEAAVARASEVAAAVPGVRDVVNRIVAVEGEEASPGGSPAEADADAGPSPEEAARAERLTVWRERADKG